MIYLFFLFTESYKEAKNIEKVFEDYSSIESCNEDTLKKSNSTKETQNNFFDSEASPVIKVKKKKFKTSIKGI